MAAEPTIVRLTVDRGVIDLPWGVPVSAIAHLWADPTAPGRWARAQWPADARGRRFVAPLDLQIGHALEITVVGGQRCYGWIADADPQRFVLAPAPDAPTAAVFAWRAVEVWRTAELAAVEAAWRERLANTSRLDAAE